MSRTAKKKVPSASRPGPSASSSRRAKSAPATPGAGPLTRLSTAINDQVSQDATRPRAKPKAASRRNKKGLVLYVDPAVTIELRRLALDTGQSVQALGMAALNMLFERHERATFPVAPEA